MSEAEDASGKVSNLTAVEAISARLAEVTRLAEKLDARLCEAGARTRPVPMSSSAMSSTSSLFSLPTSTSAASSSVQPISAGISSIATGNAPSIPMISSSTPAPQFQPRSVSTFSTTTAKGALASSSSTAPIASANGTCIGVERVPSPVVQTAAKAAEKSAAGTDSDRLDASLNRGLDAGGSKLAEDVAEDIIDKSCDGSVADDSNVECYVTATECSTTPTGRSRSESFVTSPECEDLAAPATMTPVCDTWWNIEDPKITTANAATSSSVIRRSELPKVSELEKTATLIEVSKPEICEQNGERKVEKFVTMEKIVEDKSGKIVKEVTETTTLRVSHDTRLGVASYKVISNTVQDHRENVDVKEIKDLERIVTPEAYEKTNGHHHETELGSKSESYSRRDELSTKFDDGERTMKFIKISGKTEESKPFATPVDTTKEMTLSLKEYTRHHEDSGIEMSPTKREDSLEGQDFLEKARKFPVSQACFEQISSIPCNRTVPADGEHMLSERCSESARFCTAHTSDTYCDADVWHSAGRVCPTEADGGMLAECWQLGPEFYSTVALMWRMPLYRRPCWPLKRRQNSGPSCLHSDSILPSACAGTPCQQMSAFLPAESDTSADTDARPKS